MIDRNDSGNMSRKPNCGISEEQFPTMRKCCIYSGVGALQRYQSICPYCKAWTLPPVGENLEVATIFKCRNHDYSKRVKE